MCRQAGEFGVLTVVEKDARLGQCETGRMDQGREDLTCKKREDCEIAFYENGMLDFVKLEEILKQCRFNARDPEVQSTNKLEARSIQKVDLEDELEQEKVEKRLCQAEIISLQRKLRLKENENKELKTTIEELGTVLRNAMLEKKVAGRHQGSLELQIRACENKLYETVNVLKQTQQVLEAERQHNSLRLHMKPLLALHSFLNSESTTGVGLRLASEYSGQQDVLQGDNKSKDGLHEGEETSTPLLGKQNVPPDCFDDIILPTRGPEVTVDDGATSKCRKSQHEEPIESMQCRNCNMCSQSQQREKISDKCHCGREQSFLTPSVQPFITGTQDEEKKILGHSNADVNVHSSSGIWREMVVEREFHSKTLYTDSGNIEPHSNSTTLHEAARGEGEISKTLEDQDRKQRNLDLLLRPHSFSKHKRALVEIGQKLKNEKEAKASAWNEEASTSMNDVVSGNDFMDVDTASNSTSQSIPELEFLTQDHPENQSRVSNKQVTPNQGSPFRGREQKACVGAQQGIFKDYRITLRRIMLSLVQDSKHEENKCERGAGSYKHEIKQLRKGRPPEDDKERVSKTNSVLKDVQFAKHSVRGVHQDYNTENDFEHNQTQDEGSEFNMEASQATNVAESITMQASSQPDSQQPNVNTKLQMSGVNEVVYLNDNDRRRWNLEDLEQVDFPISNSIDDEITSLRWRVVKAETTKQNDNSRTRHGDVTFTDDEEDGYESTSASQSSTKVQVAFRPSFRISRGNRRMSNKDTRCKQARLGPNNFSELMGTGRQRPKVGLRHGRHFYNLIPDSNQSPVPVERSQGTPPITLPKTKSQTAQTGLSRVNNSQHIDQGDQRKTRVEVQEQPCNRVVGGAMQGLSELLSLHEASLRERFNQGKNNKMGSSRNETVRVEENNFFVADSSRGSLARRAQLGFESRGRSRSRERGRRNLSLERQSTHSEDSRMGSTSRGRSDAEMSRDGDDPSDYFYKQKLGNKKIDSEETQSYHTLKTHIIRTPLNVFPTPVNPPDAGGTSWHASSGQDKFSCELDDALNHFEYLHSRASGSSAKNHSGPNKVLLFKQAEDIIT